MVLPPKDPAASEGGDPRRTEGRGPKKSRRDYLIPWRDLHYLRGDPKGRSRHQAYRWRSRGRKGEDRGLYGELVRVGDAIPEASPAPIEVSPTPAEFISTYTEFISTYTEFSSLPQWENGEIIPPKYSLGPTTPKGGVGQIMEAGLQQRGPEGSAAGAATLVFGGVVVLADGGGG